MSEKKTQSQFVLGEMKPSGAIVKLAVPATLALLAKAVYNIVDTARGRRSDHSRLCLLGTRDEAHRVRAHGLCFVKLQLNRG